MRAFGEGGSTDGTVVDVGFEAGACFAVPEFGGAVVMLDDDICWKRKKDIVGLRRERNYIKMTIEIDTCCAQSTVINKTNQNKLLTHRH